MSLLGESIKNIASDIGGAIASFVGSGATGRYPASFKNVTNQPNYDDGTWKSSKGYSFEVVEVDKASHEPIKNDGGGASDFLSAVKSAVGIPGGGGAWKEFRLQINPQDIQQDEVFAIEVTPTFRGVVVEHHGITIKDIVIKGTTGLSPRRKEGGASASTGNPILAGGHSGFEEFHELRSYFRAYVEAKRVNAVTKDTSELRMVFHNYKDNEHLFIEPQKFTMRRSAARATLYDYEIMVKAIGTFNQKNESKGFLDLIGNVLNQIDKAQGYLNYAVGVINGSIALLERTERNIFDAIISPIQSINNGINAVKRGKKFLDGTDGITRSLCLQLKANLLNLEMNLNDVFGHPTEFSNLLGRTATIVGTVGRPLAPKELELLNAIGAAKRGINIILAERSLFERTVNDEINDAKAVYAKAGAAAAAASAVPTQTTILNQFAPSASSTPSSAKNQITLDPNASVRQSTVLAGDTIQTIAARELGDPDKYKDLVVLNALTPPYIDPAGGPGTIKPGQIILVPQKSVVGTTGVKQNISYNISTGLNEAERNLGVDIQLNEDNDLGQSNNGDVSLVAGIQNFAQALVLKILYEQGSLKRHRFIGANLKIGSKGNNLDLIKSGIISSLSIDPRIESVPFIQLKRTGPKLEIQMIVKMKSLKMPVPVPMTLNIE